MWMHALRVDIYMIQVAKDEEGDVVSSDSWKRNAVNHLEQINYMVRNLRLNMVGLPQVNV